MDSMVTAIETLHQKGIVHGDVKLENMLLDGQNKVRLCDFAEARFMGEDEEQWEGISTWHYEAPSRRQKAEALGGCLPPPVAEDDLYGLGLSIWALNTGKIPFEDLSMDDTALHEVLLQGGTVDVSAVADEPVPRRHRFRAAAG
jgi:serine/threonine protein kinase